VVPEMREGTLAGGLPYIAFGDGPPLIVFRGLGFSNAKPTGLRRRLDPELRWLSPLARGGFTVYAVNRRPGLGVGTTTMADLATDHARALEAEFGRPVDVLGISTGGSVALQLAADHPDVPHRLVVAGSAYRLGPTGQRVQRNVADLAANGAYRRALQAFAPTLAEPPLRQRLIGGLLWLAAPLAVGRSWDPSDLVATIEAEDAFDLGDRLGEITTPTLVIGGERDRFYSRELFIDTAERIPNGRLVIYEGRGHGGTFSDRRFARDVIAFLKAEHPVPP
jgi:pimeloyl-ACP methyl ester carboxylesterase